MNTVRVYNPVKQGYDQDPSGEFVRKWVPELGGIPEEFIQEPWRWDGGGTILGRAYPWPIIDHKDAAKTEVRGTGGLV
jgi:deoxyribodipyrimidine photo-lyase